MYLFLILVHRIPGSIEEHEYFTEVLLGIKLVIQNHLHEVQVKFYDRIAMLEDEIVYRDGVISQLQHRLIEFGQNSIVLPQDLQQVGSNGTSTGSSGEIPFVVNE